MFAASSHPGPGGDGKSSPQEKSENGSDSWFLEKIYDIKGFDTGLIIVQTS
jgi:hypothetical protein